MAIKGATYIVVWRALTPPVTTGCVITSNLDEAMAHYQSRVAMERPTDTQYDVWFHEVTPGECAYNPNANLVKCGQETPHDHF